jgi:hypothetical protein
MEAAIQEAQSIGGNNRATRVIVLAADGTVKSETLFGLER